MKNFIPGKRFGRYYIPNPLDKCDLDSDSWSFSNMETIHLMNTAANLLGQLNGIASTTPNLGNYINMFTLSEAAAQCSIAHYGISFDEFLFPESHIGEYRKEIDYWRTGLNMAKMLKEMPRN